MKPIMTRVGIEGVVGSITQAGMATAMAMATAPASASSMAGCSKATVVMRNNRSRIEFEEGSSINGTYATPDTIRKSQHDGYARSFTPDLCKRRTEPSLV